MKPVRSPFAPASFRARPPLPRSLPLLALAALLFLAAPGAALAQATGIVLGRVMNATNGTYLNNARIEVVGTRRETFTNQYGDFRIGGLPAGDVTLRVSYTGLAARTVVVPVAAGESVTRDIRLDRGDTTATADDSDRVLQLDPYVVAAARDTNAASLAINEQRYSPNLKNVVAADAFGDVTEGNVGEFVKYLPGVSVDYVAADIRTISVRGFADNFTGVMVDGARMASAASGASTRSFELEQVSINNVARVEVTKVPTPDMPADTLGGSVNMVSKNAFERPGAELKYRAYVSFNSENLNPFKRTPGPGVKDTYKVLPGFDLNYSAPLTPTFGIVVNALSSNQFNEQHRSQPEWRYTGGGATVDNPYYRRYQMQDGPKNTFRDSISLKADWKLTPEQVLSASAQANYYHSFFGNRNINFDVGSSNSATGTSTAPRVNLTSGPDFTHGATNRGGVNHGTSFRDKYGATVAGNLNWHFKNDLWEINAGINGSKSRTWYRDTGRGHFSAMNVRLQNVSRVLLDDITEPRPGTFTVLDQAGAPVAFDSLANYRVLTVRSNPLDASDQFADAHVDFERDLPGLPFEASVKFGGERRIQERDIRRYDTTWNFVGADGVNNSADDGAGSYSQDSYNRQDPSWGFPAIEWPDPYKLYREFVERPELFSQTTTQQANAEIFRINGSEFIKETVDAFYLQADGRFFDNRLRLLTGVRYEKTTDAGQGQLLDPDAAFERNADGSFVTDGSGNRVRKASAGAAGSLQEVAVTRTERGFNANRSYDGYYPSFHGTWNVTDNFLVRFAYARTFGRPDFSNIIPNTTINQDDDVTPDPDAPPGLITVRNSGLRPWTADNWDLSLEYYTKGGGILSGGVFRKDIENFFGAVRTIATADDLATLGLPDQYVGWELATTTNAGDARISGFELNFRQSLKGFAGLGEYGRFFSIFANVTDLQLEGSNDADFRKFIPRTANWGFTFSRKPMVLMVKWNYRGRQRVGPTTAAPGMSEYFRARVNLDLNLEYQVSRGMTLFANARNVLNAPQDLLRISADVPGYTHLRRRENFGVQFALGLKGTF